VKVAAPTGKVTFRGHIMSVKARDGFRGGVEYKMTVKVRDAQGGVWLAWGTCQDSLVEQVLKAREEKFDFIPAPDDANLKGAEVEITATLMPGNEPHFVFFKRPKAKLIALN
jgi:hypothetical protein